MEIFEQIASMVVAGNIDEVVSLSKEAIEGKLDIQMIIDRGLIKGLDIVGEKFSSGELYLPEMLMAGRAVSSGMEILKPSLVVTEAVSRGTIVLGTVQQDIHDIGKNIVGMMLEGSGFKVIDLGTDVAQEKFINAARINNADIIAMSALLSTTMVNMEDVVKNLRSSELSEKVKVMVGGAPMSKKFAKQIGADGYAPDASLAVKKARELLGSQGSKSEYLKV